MEFQFQTDFRAYGEDIKAELTLDCSKLLARLPKSSLSVTYEKSYGNDNLANNGLWTYILLGKRFGLVHCTFPDGCKNKNDILATSD